MFPKDSFASAESCRMQRLVLALTQLAMSFLHLNTPIPFTGFEHIENAQDS